MTSLKMLTATGRVWTGKHWQRAAVNTLASGWARLDDHLPGGGWPLGGITEVLVTLRAQGEIRLLLPALGRLSRRDSRWQLWLNPPLQPCGPALQQWGVNTEHVLVAQAHQLNDFCYSIEKSLQSGGCQAVVAWCKKLDKSHLRRLQLAAEKADSPVFLLRPASFAKEPSIAALRLCMRADHRVDILKRRAGWPVAGVSLVLSRYRQAVVL